METEDRVRRRHVRASEAPVSLEPELDLKKLLRALQAVGFSITSIRDVTPIPHNGVRQS